MLITVQRKCYDGVGCLVSEPCIEGQVSPLAITDPRAQSELLARCTAPSSSTLPLPRMLLFFAHPDDEVLAIGGRLERLRSSRLLTITDGAPANGADAHHHGFASLQEYKDARKSELLDALAHAGLSAEVAPTFARQVPDQGASFDLEPLARQIAAEVDKFKPEAVMTHPYEGGHPDHDACAFAVHAAVRLLGLDLPVLEAPFYHAGPGGSMQTGAFLARDPEVEALSYELTPEEQTRKAERLACFRSQAETLAQFRVDREVFRLAPRYDFTERPQADLLFYERFPWGMMGDEFCALAKAANAQLFSDHAQAVAENASDRSSVIA